MNAWINWLVSKGIYMLRNYFFKLFICFICLFLTEPIRATLSLSQKAGQMLIIGFNGTTLTPDNPIIEDIKQNRIGGVILFSKNADVTRPNLEKNIKNPKQVKRLISDLQLLSTVPLFIAVDQEGGKVARLGKNFDVSQKSAFQLGQENDEKLTFKEAKKTAKTLHYLGFNVNFAPCVDVAFNKNSPIIAGLERSFSDDPTVVAKHALQVVQAHQKYHVLPVLKHFPGHGSAKGDTHTDFVDITQDAKEEELIPYQKLISQKAVDGIMTTHVFNQKIDSKYPLSLSYNSITGLLREKLHFTGLVFSDDLQMKALSDHFSLEEMIIQAINAGTDVLIFGNNLSYQPDIASKALRIILKAVQEGKISEQRINDSFEKIQQTKKKLKLL